MSSIRLLKDHAKGKKGEMISAPFMVARDMVDAGLAEYPPQPDAPKAAKSVAPSQDERHAAEIVRLNAVHAQDLAAVRAEAKEAQDKMLEDHVAEIGRMQADLDAANAKVAELNAKKSK